MKKSLAIIAGAAALMLVLSTSLALAKEKVVTLSGEAVCAKCVLKLKDAKTCETVIQVKRDKKKPQIYHLVQNEVSKGFKQDVCKAPVKVTFTGTTKTENGKKELILSKIEVAK